MVRRQWAAILACCIGSVAPAAAQRYATLAGHILDTSQGGIAGAAITVINEDTGFRRTTESELGGAYVIASLDAGVYKVTVRKENFQTVVRFNLALAASTSTLADFTLPVGSVLETIVVHGETQPLERDGASTGSQFDAYEIQRLPLNGAGMLGLLESVPGTDVTPATRGEAGQFTTAGQRPNANYFMLDGVSANNGVTAGGLPAGSSGGTLPAVTAFGSLDSLIALEAVREFSVATSSTGAEMGRLPGAQVAITSQSGSNALHGSTVYRWRDQAVGGQRLVRQPSRPGPRAAPAERFQPDFRRSGAPRPHFLFPLLPRNKPASAVRLDAGRAFLRCASGRGSVGPTGAGAAAGAQRRPARRRSR